MNFACCDLMWGELSATQFDAWLDEVKALGFTGVGVRSPYTRPYLKKPAEFAEKLSRRGLKLAGAYIPVERSAEEFRDLCALVRACNCDSVILHGYKRGGAKEREELAKILNERGAVSRELCVVTMFHHHTSVPYETLEETEEQLKLTDAKKVALFVDTGHATRDFIELPVKDRAAALLKRQWARVKYVEFKDWSPETDLSTELGTGQADIAAAAKVLIEKKYSGWITLEQNSPTPGCTPGECAKRSLEYARKVTNAL
jgi:sugar phosphate isomerase/epimerase